MSGTLIRHVNCYILYTRVYLKTSYTRVGGRELRNKLILRPQVRGRRGEAAPCCARAPWRPEREWASHYSSSIFASPRVCNPAYPRGTGPATPQTSRRTQQSHRGAVESSVRGGEGGACAGGQKAASNAPYVHLLKALNVSLSVRLRGCCERPRQRHSPGALHPRRGHLGLLLTMIYVVEVNDCLKEGRRSRRRPYPSCLCQPLFWPVQDITVQPSITYPFPSLCWVYLASCFIPAVRYYLRNYVGYD